MVAPYDPSIGRTIFLDIDGCLTSVEDGSSFLCMEDESYGLSASRMALLKGLLDATGAFVVVSSNWRRFPDDGCWKVCGHTFHSRLLELRKALGDRYLGDLPECRHATKSEALLEWGNLNGVDFDAMNFAIVDDDPEEGFRDVAAFAGRYVQCDPVTGLTGDDCLRLSRILGMPS